MGGQGDWFLLLGKRQARECFSIIDSYKETGGSLSAAMLRGSVIQQQTALNGKSQIRRTPPKSPSTLHAPPPPYTPQNKTPRHPTPPPKNTSSKQKSSPCIPFGTQGEPLFQLRSDESNYTVLPRCGLIICTARPDGSDARNEPRRPPGSWRTAPWHAPGRRGSGGCNGSRWPGTPDTCPCCQPWR